MDWLCLLKIPSASANIEFSPFTPSVPDMRTIIFLSLSFLGDRVRSRASLEIELLALRRQLAILKRTEAKCPRFGMTDRVFWVWLSRVWLHWRQALFIVKPETVVSWHRRGFRLFSSWKSCTRGRGRLATTSINEYAVFGQLHSRMARANLLQRYGGGQDQPGSNLWEGQAALRLLLGRRNTPLVV